MRHIHFLVQGFDDESESGRLTGLVTLDLIAQDEGAAISKAQKLVLGRNWYRVSSVIEHDPDLEVASQASEPILQQLKDGELTLDRIQILEQTGEIKIIPDLAKAKSRNGTN